jgi:hypothetical protein
MHSFGVGALDTKIKPLDGLCFIEATTPRLALICDYVFVPPYL